MRNEKCQVVSVVNFKGGVGKSTVTFNLGYELSDKGYKVLIIDFDGQGNLTRFSGVNNITDTITNALINEMDEKEAIYPIYPVKGGLDIIPCNVLKEQWMIIAPARRFNEQFLKRYIERIKNLYDYDFILIDNAPSIGIDLQNSLMASDMTLIVCEADMPSVDGVNNVLSVIGEIEKYGNHKIRSAGVLINKFEASTNLHSTMLAAIKEMWGSDHHIYESIIPKSIDAGTSSSSSMAIADYKKSSKIAQAYKNFTDEFLRVVDQN